VPDPVRVLLETADRLGADKSAKDSSRSAGAMSFSRIRRAAKVRARNRRALLIRACRMHCENAVRMKRTVSRADRRALIERKHPASLSDRAVRLPADLATLKNGPPPSFRIVRDSELAEGGFRPDRACGDGDADRRHRQARWKLDSCEKLAVHGEVVDGSSSRRRVSRRNIRRRSYLDPVISTAAAGAPRSSRILTADFGPILDIWSRRPGTRKNTLPKP